MAWGSIGVLAAVASYRFGILTAYHFWAAGGPPNTNVAWHLQWADRFQWAMLVSLVTFVLTTWKCVRTIRRQRR